MQTYKTCQKLNSSKTCHFRRFQPKRIAPLNSASYFFTYCSTGQFFLLTFFRFLYFSTLKSLKLCILDVLKAWDYARTIFQSEKLRIAYIKAEKDTRKHNFRYFEGPKVVRQRPFEPKYLISCESKVACNFLKKSPRVL